MGARHSHDTVPPQFTWTVQCRGSGRTDFPTQPRRQRAPAQGTRAASAASPTMLTSLGKEAQASSPLPADRRRRQMDRERERESKAGGSQGLQTVPTAQSCLSSSRPWLAWLLPTGSLSSTDSHSQSPAEGGRVRQPEWGQQCRPKPAQKRGSKAGRPEQRRGRTAGRPKSKSTWEMGRNLTGGTLPSRGTLGCPFPALTT